MYAMKFQTLALPNGLIANMYGPVGEYANEIPSIIPSMNARLYRWMIALIFFNLLGVDLGACLGDRFHTFMYGILYYF